MKTIIIGSGLAGLTSAYFSYKKGDTVILLEKLINSVVILQKHHLV